MTARPAKTSAGGRNTRMLELIVLAVTGVLILLFSIRVSGFASLGNLGVILSNSASLLILSCGMGVVIIARGLDLSQIAAMVAGATTFSMLIANGTGAPLALGLTVVAMMLVGLANAWLIAYAEIPAILATLASAMLITGFFRFAILQGEFMLVFPKTDPALQFLSRDLLPGLPTPIAFMLLAMAVTWGLLHLSAIGRTIYAMGDNFQAARLTGLPVRPAVITVFIFSALTALLAGMLTSSASGTVDFRTVTNGTLLFDVILVVVLGGIPLRGGRGGVRNIVIGVALIAVLRNGMTLMNFTTQVQDMFKGLVLLTAIVADNYFNPRDTETDTVGDL